MTEDRNDKIAEIVEDFINRLADNDVTGKELQQILFAILIHQFMKAGGTKEMMPVLISNSIAKITLMANCAFDD